ncbi:MAG: DsbA family protein [Deltaproteobacteria bacterium]|nr:DsbA family protein [Deltaproteobacteria bacterium]
MRVVIALIVSLAAGLVVATVAGAAPAANLSGAPTDKIATVGPRTITRGELEDKVRSKLIDLDNQRYDALREGLDDMVAAELIQQEATARGVSIDALQKAEIESKVTAPTDEEIQKVFDDNKAQLKDQTLEQVKPQIVTYLNGQRAQDRLVAFIEELKKKHKTTIALKPPLTNVATAGRPARGGGAKAPVTIIEFSDYQCPFCKRAEDSVNKVMQVYGDKVRLVFRDYPLPMHSQARPAAEAAGCANAQGKFWEYHAKLFDNQTALGEDKLKQYAKDVGLDEAKFAECFTKKPFKAAIDQDVADGMKVGVNGTPAFFVNGRMLSGAQPFEKFKEIIDDEIAAKKTASAS